MSEQPQAPDNLRIWSQVEKTKKSMTKQVGQGAYRFTAIDAHSQIKRATEIFGPMGQGWGVSNSHFEMLVVDPTDPHFNLLTYTAVLWYRLDGQECRFDIAADIELQENTRNGWKRVSDPYKKVATDALTKGLSRLGFNADVFLGLFDSQKYLDQLDAEERAERQAEERRKKEGAQLATQEQMDAIQHLAGQAGLAGADFAQWLRETCGTSWSRLTAAQADQAIAGLESRLKQGAA